MPRRLRESPKNSCQIDRCRGLNPGPPESESRAQPRSHLIWFGGISFFVLYLSSPIEELPTTGLTTQMPIGQMAVERTQTFDQNTRQRAGLPESMISRISGPPPEKHTTEQIQSQDSD